MSTMSRWWVERTQPQRFDLFTRGSLYSMLVLAPLFAVGLSSRVLFDGVGAVVFLILTFVLTVIAWIVLRGGIAYYLGSAPWPRRASWALIVTAVLTMVACVVAFGPVSADLPPDGPGRISSGFLLIAAVTFAAFSALLPSDRMFMVVTGTAVSFGALAWLIGDSGRSVVGIVVSTVLGLTGVCGAFRGSVWMLGIVWELDRSRRVEARLAVAEERLRFSRDLHDVLGRNLSVIALKSELAAQLVDRGRDQAGPEMMAVRDIAQDSVRDLREVVRGYREADLGTELAGARSVLRSASVRTRVLGESGDLSPAAQSVLGWVAREGTTNVLRHSTATTCEIAVTSDRDTVTLTMENDGVSAADRERGGSGLSGLEERLRHLGGVLKTERIQPDRFRLTATVPRRMEEDEDQ